MIKWFIKRLVFFRCWVGLYIFFSGAAILYSIYFMEEQSYRISMACFGQFWVSMGLYQFFRDPVKAEKAMWDAVEKHQREEREQQNAG